MLKVDHGPYPSRSGSRIRGGTRGTLSKDGPHCSADELYQYWAGEVARWTDLIPIHRCRKYIATFRTFEAVALVEMLGDRQQTVVE